MPSGFFLDIMQAVVLAYHMTATSSSGADGDDPDARSERPHLAKDESDGLVRARRGEKIQKILEDAKGRDDEATVRDAVADERDRVADLKAFTDPNGPLVRGVFVERVDKAFGGVPLTLGLRAVAGPPEPIQVCGDRGRVLASWPSACCGLAGVMRFLVPVGLGWLGWPTPIHGPGGRVRRDVADFGTKFS